MKYNKERKNRDCHHEMQMEMANFQNCNYISGKKKRGR